MDAHNLKTLFFNEKPTDYLLALLQKKDQKSYTNIISKETDCTFTHALRITHLFEEAELIHAEKKGRIKHIQLTDKGRTIAKQLQQLTNTLQDAN